MSMKKESNQRLHIASQFTSSQKNRTPKEHGIGITGNRISTKILKLQKLSLNKTAVSG